MHLIGGTHNFQALPIRKLWDKDDDQILAYMRGDLVFVFNFNPVKSFCDYGFLAPAGEYHGVIDSDNARYGGYGNVDEGVNHLTQPDPLYDSAGLGWLKLYIPARSALILRLQPQRPKTAKKSAAKPAAKKKAKK